MADQEKGRLQMRVDPEELKRWKHAAIDLDMTLSELVREAVNIYIQTAAKGDQRRGN